MGSDEDFAAQIDRVFDTPPIVDPAIYGGVAHEVQEMQIAYMGNYAHGNQPAQHMIYLYDWCAQPWKAQARVREVMDKLYSWYPDGYCGDEDNGQTSAWYVFSALGFYPVCPGTGEYALGSPLFKYARINLSDGKDVLIAAAENSPSNCYISSMSVDGKSWTKNYLTHQQLSSGADIDFIMSAEPNTSRGTADNDKPYSFSNER
jgi:predicted alpha-1,2-mannosidase